MENSLAAPLAPRQPKPRIMRGQLVTLTRDAVQWARHYGSDHHRRVMPWCGVGTVVEVCESGLVIVDFETLGFVPRREWLKVSADELELVQEKKVA